MSDLSIPHIAIIGGGAAGLMAADILRAYPVQVSIYEAKPSVGRKFLLAGKGGMNITHSEDFDAFCQRYGAEKPFLQPMLEQFNNQAVRDWMQGLGFDSFVGSSGRVFPTDMKAAPLLRAWLHRLRESGIKICVRHRWLGWTNESKLKFATPEGEQHIAADAVILACGGGSWPQLGSDGAWQSVLQAQGISVKPLQAANCGFDSQWSSNFSQEFAGQPIKSAVLAFTDAQGNAYRKQGDFVITATGIEGSLIYALSRPLREFINQNGKVTVYLDLFPHKTVEQLYTLLNKPRAASLSWSSFVRKQLGIQGVKAALLRECTTKQQMQDVKQLASLLKVLPITLTQTRPIAEAISSAGGVKWSALTADLQLKNRPKVFCAGEMIDWEAPTGGYLLTACFATAKCAALGVVRELGSN
ncbi:MAG TPA: TIGR03862 family flavoprotein [Agitococcus sp.]|nr:TIGR03862 family flavoprotein [Agitococcus sp.]